MGSRAQVRDLHSSGFLRFRVQGLGFRVSAFWLAQICHDPDQVASMTKLAHHPKINRTEHPQTVKPL